MKKILFISGCLSLLFFTACQKEMSSDFIRYTNNPLNDTVWTRSVPSTATVNELLNSLLPQIIVDSFDLSRDTTLTYGDSLSVSFTAGSCVGSPNNGGSPATVASGKVYLEIVRLKTKGDYIKAFKATTSNGYLLESAGGFFVRVIKEGKELTLAPGASFKIRFSDTEDPKINMQAFYGKESPLFPPINIIDTGFNWVRGADTTRLTTFQKQGTGGIVKGYELKATSLRWIAAERFTDSTKAKTKITAILSPNYTNKTTAVFAVFANQKTIVYLGPDYASRSYAANNIPIGSKITLLSFSKIGGDFYMGIKEINDVGMVTSYTITPEKTTLVKILTYLNTL